MKQMQFTVTIHAPKQKVWNTLWQDETLREWAGIIDPGTHMVGQLTQGAEVQFISGNGYGVTSFVKELALNEYVLLLHQADTQESGATEREKEWTGGQESYTLTETDGTTTLTAAFDVPPELEEYFTDTYPKAMECIKQLSEA